MGGESGAVHRARGDETDTIISEWSRCVCVCVCVCARARVCACNT